jgi:uncharacterized protein YndB with AHSA1/START domain
MSDSATGLVVRKGVTVEVPIERAFEVFTAGFDRWWPRSHHIATVEMAEAIMEPLVGGRWYERGVDGSECEWGVVLAWDPPRHVALRWQLDGTFQFEPDVEKCSRVDIRFEADGANRTRVELVHSEIERHTDFDALRTAVDSDGGWALTLRNDAACVESDWDRDHTRHRGPGIGARAG